MRRSSSAQLAESETLAGSGYAGMTDWLKECELRIYES
jgi:hypothetical protein